MKRITLLLILWHFFSLFNHLQAQAPIITSFNPTTGTIGSIVTLTGSGFNASAAQNVVFFGQVKATIISAGATNIQVKIPVGASYQPLSATNLGTQLTGYTTNSFIPTFKTKNNISPADFDTTINVAHVTNLITGIKIADIDGDGKPDMVVLNNSNTIGAVASVYHNVSANGTISAASFDTKVDFAAGEGPVLIQDLNGDGKPDMVVLDPEMAKIHSYMNNSVSGTLNANSFIAEPEIDLGGLPIRMKLADMDGDGKPDLIIIFSRDTADQSFAICRNISTAGKIAFSAPQLYKNGQIPTCFAVGDIDGDGKPDLIFGNADNTITAYQNNSTNGTITLGAKITLGSTVYSLADMQMADIDGDGKLDLIAGYNQNASLQSHQVSLFRNQLAGNAINTTTFATETDIAVGQESELIKVADMDGDGKPDMIIEQNGALSILRNGSSSGSISFSTKADVVPGTVYSISFDIADFDGDGRPDIVFNNTTSNEIAIMHSAPLPAKAVVVPPVVSNFTPPTGLVGTAVVINGSNFNTTTAAMNVTLGAVKAKVTNSTATQLTVQVPAGENYSPISVIDTKTGLGSSTAIPFINTFKGSGIIDTSVLKFQNTVTAVSSPSAIAVADLDGDGKPDLVFRDIQTQTVTTILPNTTVAGGLITFKTKIEYPATQYVNNIILTDIDGDGKLDIVESTYVSDIWGLSIYLNTSTVGNISFAPRMDFPYKVNYITTGDLNGDGKTDIAGIVGLPAENHQAIILQNTSTPGKVSFAAPVSFGLNILASVIGVRDLDGDNKPDMIIANSGGNTLSVFRNLSANGGISFAGGVDLATTGSDLLKIADLDADNKPDLITAKHIGGTSASILRNISSPGKIAFAAHQDVAAGDNIFDIDFSDINGDGKVDLMTANGSSLKTSVSQNTSTAGKISFAAKTDFLTTGPSPIQLNLVDLDGDGRPDAAINYGNGISIVKNMMPAIPLPTITAGGPLTFAQGDSVLLTANPGSGGYTYEWQKNGITITGATKPVYTARDSGAYTIKLTQDSTSRTSAAVQVNAIFVLPANNFIVTITGASCKGSSNGMIKINSKQSLPYSVTVTGNGVNTTLKFTDSVTVNNLPAGTYSACITVAQHTGYQQCYTVVIEEPKDLSVYSVVNSANNTITLSLNGGSQYTIQLNGQAYQTKANSITLPLNDCSNELTVTTDKLCQGTVQKTISVPPQMMPYPVPFQNVLNINTGNKVIAVALAKIYNLSDGKLVYSNQYYNVSGILQLDVSALSNGAYFLKVTFDNSEKVFKIMKKLPLNSF